jgi:hypothetical protein
VKWFQCFSPVIMLLGCSRGDDDMLLIYTHDRNKLFYSEVLPLLNPCLSLDHATNHLTEISNADTLGPSKDTDGCVDY